MDRLKMRLEVIKAETLGVINKCFRFKVQLEEQLEENEVNLHFHRGIMEGLMRAQKDIEELQRGEEIEKLKEDRRQRLSLSHGTDHAGSPEDIPSEVRTDA